MKSTQSKKSIAGAIDALIIQNVEKVIATGRLYRYDCSTPEESEVSLLERDFAAFVGSKYAVAVNSCSSAIFLSLICSGVKPGDKVLIPAFTFLAVPSAVVHAGAVPVLVEINDNYSLNTDDLKKMIARDTRYLLLSYMRGHVPNLDEVISICSRNGIMLIEDCAHSLGVDWDGIPTGRFGTAGCFSMQSYKIIDGGEGGILVTDDEEVSAKAILYAGSYERLWTRHFDTSSHLARLQKSIPAYNFRMSNLTASVVRPQLTLIRDRIKKYNDNYFHLTKILSRSPHIHFPARERKASLVADSVQFNLQGLTREQMLTFGRSCKERGVNIEIFGLSQDNARCYWNWDFLGQTRDLPATRKILESACDMRLRLFLTEEDITAMGAVILESIEYAKAL